VNVDLPELKDKFSSSEKRLGHKRAILAELELEGGGKLSVAACQLDSNASPAGRARQLAALLDALPAGPALVGGDLNSSTFDLATPLALARDLLHKLLVTGFDRTVENYLTPELRYETPIFEALARRGFTTEGWNDRATGTLRYDFNDPYVEAMARKAAGRLLVRWLKRRLRPFGGVVPARLDWFAARELAPRAARTADPRGASDHAPIVVELA
jgi:endonuclease/exonuclease/phosphatase family metal-dependent hydrolase